MSRVAQITPVIIPGIRQELDFTMPNMTNTPIFAATARFPAKSILRRYFMAVDCSMLDARNVLVRMATGDASVPVAADFVGSGLILPQWNLVGSPPLHHPDGITDSQWHEINYQLPDGPSRLMFQASNANIVDVNMIVKLVIDGVAQLGE